MVLPVAATVCIVLACWAVAVLGLFVIYRWLKNRGSCECNCNLCGSEDVPCCRCCIALAETCDCCNPNIGRCFDSCCPKKKLSCVDILLCQCCAAAGQDSCIVNIFPCCKQDSECCNQDCRACCNVCTFFWYLFCGLCELTFFVFWKEDANGNVTCRKCTCPSCPSDCICSCCSDSAYCYDCCHLNCQRCREGCIDCLECIQRADDNIYLKSKRPVCQFCTKSDCCQNCACCGSCKCRDGICNKYCECFREYECLHNICQNSVFTHCTCQVSEQRNCFRNITCEKLTCLKCPKCTSGQWLSDFKCKMCCIDCKFPHIKCPDLPVCIPPKSLCSEMDWSIAPRWQVNMSEPLMRYIGKYPKIPQCPDNPMCFQEFDGGKCCENVLAYCCCMWLCMVGDVEFRCCDLHCCRINPENCMPYLFTMFPFLFSCIVISIRNIFQVLFRILLNCILGIFSCCKACCLILFCKCNSGEFLDTCQCLCFECTRKPAVTEVNLPQLQTEQQKMSTLCNCQFKEDSTCGRCICCCFDWDIAFPQAPVDEQQLGASKDMFVIEGAHQENMPSYQRMFPGRWHSRQSVDQSNYQSFPQDRYNDGQRESLIDKHFSSPRLPGEYFRDHSFVMSSPELPSRYVRHLDLRDVQSTHDKISHGQSGRYQFEHGYESRNNTDRCGDSDMVNDRSMYANVRTMQPESSTCFLPYAAQDCNIEPPFIFTPYSPHDSGNTYSKSRKDVAQDEIHRNIMYEQSDQNEKLHDTLQASQNFINSQFGSMDANERAQYSQLSVAQNGMSRNMLCRPSAQSDLMIEYKNMSHAPSNYVNRYTRESLHPQTHSRRLFIDQMPEDVNDRYMEDAMSLPPNQIHNPHMGRTGSRFNRMADESTFVSYNKALDSHVSDAFLKQQANDINSNETKEMNRKHHFQGAGKFPVATDGLFQNRDTLSYKEAFASEDMSVLERDKTRPYDKQTDTRTDKLSVSKRLKQLKYGSLEPKVTDHDISKTNVEAINMDSFQSPMSAKKNFPCNDSYGEQTPCYYKQNSNVPSSSRVSWKVRDAKNIVEGKGSNIYEMPHGYYADEIKKHHQSRCHETHAISSNRSINSESSSLSDEVMHTEFLSKVQDTQDCSTLCTEMEEQNIAKIVKGKAYGNKSQKCKGPLKK